MTPTRVWIPGWHFRSSVFEPLQRALPDEEHINLDHARDDGGWPAWIERQHEAIPERAHLVGWSLGGMLAVAAAKHRPDIASVTVLCANVQFSGGSSGLDPAVADDFRRRYRAQPERALKRFLTLVQGGKTSFGLTDSLASGDQGDTLDWLYQITLDDAWLTCPVRVLLANDDTLVPARPAAKAWLKLGAEPRLMDGGHDLPWQEPERVVAWMRDDG